MDKLCQTNNKYKSIFQNLNIKKKKNLSNEEKNKRSIGILTSAICSNKIISLKNRNKNFFGLPRIRDENKKYQIPLIYMNESKFVDEIISNNNNININNNN